MGTAKRPVIGITMGDPAGIGTAIIVKAILEFEINKICRPVVIGDAEVIKKILKTCRLRAEIKVIEKIASAPAGSGKIEIVDLHNIDVKGLKYGVPGKACGSAAVSYIKMAAGLALAKKIDAITTAPINKEIINAAGFQYPGHTELLAELAGTKDFGLMMVGGGLRVILVTTHMALKDVFRHIKKDKVLRTIRLVHKAKERYYDIVVAMYHDQGLIPLKLLAFGKAVNVTVGLPFIRTSVDHGTAYDISGKDCAV